MEETKQLTDKTPAQIENEAIEGNEIIAAWLGWIRREPGEYNLPNWWEPDMNDLRLKGKFRGYPHQLKFHSSWDWLMPVLEKINSLRGWNFTISWDGSVVYDDNFKYTAQGKVFSSKGGLDIRTVYSAVIQFIKWHSNQPQKAS